MITLGALFAALSALFQLIPFFFSEVLVLLTIFSALPIYIISRINPKTGILAYFVAGSLVMLLSVHEGLLFLCTNGMIGLSLGICCYFMKRRITICVISSILLTVALYIINYGIGIPVFGGDLPGELIVQLAILLSFSIIYNMIYLHFSNFIYNRLKKLGYLDKLV